LAAMYRYFASKEHLLAEALVDWAEERARAYERPPRGGTPTERFVDVVRRGIRGYRKSPQYAELFLESSASRDAHAVACMGRLSNLVGGGMRAALDGIDHDTAEAVRTAVGHAWVGGLFECVHGRETFAELETNLVRTCRLLVDPLLS